MAINLLNKICKFSSVCGNNSTLRLLGYGRSRNIWRTYYCHKSGISIPDEQIRNIRQYEDYMSKFKLANDIVKRILSDKDICLNSSTISERNKEVIDYNLVGGRCKRVQLFFNTYYNLSSSLNLSDQHILRASIMSYINEMILSAFMIIDDIIDGSEKRRNKLSWFKKVGKIASSDIVLIESGIDLVMRNFFENEPYYMDCLKVLHDVKWIISCSMSLDYLTFDILGTNRKNCNWEVYNQLAFGIMGVSGFYMPLATAMHMVDFEFNLDLLLQMTAVFGRYAAIENDFVDRYPVTTGKLPDEDIKLGKLTWLLLTALEHGNSRQKAIIEDCYGKNDPKCIKAVVDVYEELEMKDRCISHKKDIFNSTSEQINLVSDAKMRKCLMDALHMIEYWYQDS